MKSTIVKRIVVGLSILSLFGGAAAVGVQEANHDCKPVEAHQLMRAGGTSGAGLEDDLFAKGWTMEGNLLYPPKCMTAKWS